MDDRSGVDILGSSQSFFNRFNSFVIKIEKLEGGGRIGLVFFFIYFQLVISILVIKYLVDLGIKGKFVFQDLDQEFGQVEEDSFQIDNR